MNANSKSTMKMAILFIAFLILSSSFAQIPTDSLMSFWAFNEGSGTVAHDSSGHNRSAALNGASWTTGVSESALLLPTTSSYLQADSVACYSYISTAMSISFWINPGQIPVASGTLSFWGAGIYGIIMNKWTSGKEDIFIALDSAMRIRFHLYLPSSPNTQFPQLYSKTRIPLNKWTNISATYNGAAMILYINGSSDSSIAASGLIGNSSGNLYLGDNPVRPSIDIPSTGFVGALDNFMIYNRALSASEAQALYAGYDAPLAAPVLLSPTNNALNVSINANLSWNSSTAATSYRVQLSNTTSFLLTNDTIISNNSRIISSLATSSLYYWRVYATNGLGNSPWSGIWSFNTISMPSTPVLSYPSNGSTSIPISTTLSWDTVSSASLYRIQISNSATFWIVNDTLTSLSNRTALLVSNTMYYWRVYAINDAGNSAWSTVYNFYTGTSSVLASRSQNAKQCLFITGNMVNYSLEKPCLVAINYYDINGRRVMSLINRYQNAGKYSFIIPKDNLPAGTYLQAFRAGDKSQMNKIAITR